MLVRLTANARNSPGVAVAGAEITTRPATGYMYGGGGGMRANLQALSADGELEASHRGYVVPALSVIWPPPSGSDTSIVFAPALAAHQLSQYAHQLSQ